MYKGFYVAVVRIDFSIDEKMTNLRPFNELKAEIEDGKLTNIITDLLKDELGVEHNATVSVKQTGAVLVDIPERQKRKGSL